MKLLLITAAFPPMQIAGEADHAYHLCKRLADSGVEVHVVTTKGNITKEHLNLNVYPVMRHWSWSDLPRLVSYMKWCTPDAILLMYSGGPHYNYHPMVTFLPTISTLMLPGVHFVTQFENVYPPHWTSLLERCVRKALSFWSGPFGTLLQQSDRVIVLSDHQRIALAKHCSMVDSKCILIPPPPLMHICPENNGASRQHGRQLLGIAPDDFLLVYFGFIYPGKGVETLLKAVDIVTGRRSGVRLALIGGSVELPSRPSYGKEMRMLSKQLGIDDKVTWVGAYDWDSNEASVYLRSADICILPFEGGVRLNNSSFAAAATHGLPIITTHGAMVERPFKHQENVFLCPPSNPDCIATAIETLMDDPDLRQRLSEGSLNFAQEWFSWSGAIDRTIFALS